MNIINDNTIRLTDDSQRKNEIAEYLENVIKDAVTEYKKESGYTITDAEIMFRDNQVFVGMNSVKFEKN